ncbi:MAG: hypothetical protein HYS27_27670 [Deltaproteobacteria bacterium]|nr:hypothetical protein [Deltaproteobacteria bacterium]
MTLNLPLLEASGAVMFDSPEAVEFAWATYVSKGALAVKPDRELQPLEQLEVYLFGGGIATPVRLRVEVVVLTPERALLRLTEPAPPLPTLQRAASPAPAVAEPGPADVARTDQQVPIPGSQSDHGMVAVLEEPAPLPRAAPPPLDDSVMPSPSLSADALPRTSTPFLAIPAPVLPAEHRPTPTVSPGPPVLELERVVTPAPIVLERIDAAPAAHVMPAVTAEREPAPTPAAPASPAANAAAANVVAALPPFFTGDALRFSSAQDFAAGRPHLENVGAILAVADGRLPTTSVEVRLIVGSKETAAKARVTLAAAAPGTAVVQAAERSGFLRLLAELDGTGSQRQVPMPSQTTNIPATFAAPAAPAAQGEPAAPAPRAFNLPRQGPLENPTTAQGILALPLVRPPTDAEIAKPSVPLLLRWLRTTRGVLRLEVTATDHPLFTAVIVDGREVRTPAALSTLGRSLSQPRMTYSITELGRPPQMTTIGRTLHLIAESVRGLIATVETEDLARAFPGRTGLCLRARNDIVQSLGLPAQHQRFIKSDLGGDQLLDEAARAAVGARTVWETLYLLELYGGLSWDEPDPNKAKTAAARTGTFRFTAPETTASDDAWAPFDGKDHFNVLGLHWSSSPTEVPEAYQKLRAEYSTGGVKRPANVATAERILKRLEEAYKVLNEKPTRQAYRREKYNLQWAHQAQLLVQKAKLSLYRKDFADAKNILLAAEDMAPSDEARALLASIKSKLG